MEAEALDKVDWCKRCAQRITELDPDVLAGEAWELARDLHGFERTRAMGPLAAASFVATEMKRAERGPFERRSRPRRAGEPQGDARDRAQPPV